MPSNGGKNIVFPKKGAIRKLYGVDKPERTSDKRKPQLPPLPRETGQNYEFV